MPDESLTNFHIVYMTDEAAGITVNLFKQLTVAEHNEYLSALKIFRHWVQSDIEIFTMFGNAYTTFINTIESVKVAFETTTGPIEINPTVDARTELIKINSAFVGFLNMMRLYLDHTARKIGSRNKATLATHKEATYHEFDTHFSYRFFSRLRNYAQHQGIPITGMEASADFNSITQADEYSFALFFDREELLLYKGAWSRIVLQDLRNSNERFPVMPLASEVITSMNNIRVASVKAFSPLIQEQINVMRHYKELIKDLPTPAHIVKLDVPEDLPSYTQHRVYSHTIPVYLINYVNDVLAA